MPAPGMPDFSAMAKEATKALNTEPAKVETVPIAKSEVAVPAPEQAIVKDSYDEPTEEVSVEVANNDDEPVAKANNDVAPKAESQEQLQQKVFDLPDDALVNLRIDGEDTQVSVKEYKDLLRKNATLTKRQQEFARSREEANALLTQQWQQIQWEKQQLEARQQQAPQLDPVTQAIVDALKGQVPQAKVKSPDEIATIGEIQAEREALLAQFTQQRQQDQQEFQNQLVQAAQNVELSNKLKEERKQYLDGINGLLKKKDYSALSEISPNIVAEAMFHVKELKPQNLDEALEYTEDYIKERSLKLKKLMTSANQKQQATAVRQKMESPEGSTPTIVKANGGKKTFITKAGKLDFNAMSKDALARMNSME